MVWDGQCLEDYELKDDSINELTNYKGVHIKVEADTLKFCFTPILATLNSKLSYPPNTHKTLLAAENCCLQKLVTCI